MRSSLSDLQIRKAKPKDKSYKLQDGGGMYLLITPAGGKLWRIDYRFAGRRKTLSIGPYPVIPLAEAREKLLKVKQWLASGIDPAHKKNDCRAWTREPLFPRPPFPGTKRKSLHGPKPMLHG